MNTELDYRLFEHRQEGFDQFYRFHCLTNDYSPDIAVETWMADDMDFDWEKRCVMALFHGATYAGPCESMFADRFPIMTADVQPQIEFFQEHKSRLLFHKCGFPNQLRSSEATMPERMVSLGSDGTLVLHRGTDSIHQGSDIATVDGVQRG